MRVPVCLSAGSEGKKPWTMGNSTNLNYPPTIKCSLLVDSWSGDRFKRHARDRKVSGSSPPQKRRENYFLLLGQLSVLTLISVSVPPRCYRSGT